MAGSIRAAAAALFCFYFLCSCGSQKEKPVLEVFEQKYKIDPQGNLRINNPRGSIAIRGVDSDEVLLRATKVASSDEHVRNISVSVAAQPNDILIKTNFVRPKGKPFLSTGKRVDYELTIPRTLKITRLDMDDGKVLIDSVQTSELRANVVDGQLELRNCSGDIQVAVQNGDLSLVNESNVQPAHLSMIDARVLSGTLTVSLPRKGSFHVRAATPTGNITSAFAQDVQVGGGALRKIDISLGQTPRSDIQLNVMSGNVIIADATADSRTAGQSQAANPR
jgi:hypothetical protein